MERIYVWDRFVRSLHWLLAALVLLNYFVIEEGGLPHRLLGYAAVLIVSLRLAWGCADSGYARLRNFLPNWTRLRNYLACYRGAQRCVVAGHNPLGASMALLMLGLVMSLGVTGWMMGTDAYWGEEWLEHLHAVLADTLIACAGVHVAMVLVMSRLTRINLPKSMLTGYKERDTAAPAFQGVLSERRDA